MSFAMADSRHAGEWPGPPVVARACALAFVYWVLFLIVLEPGDIFGVGGHDPGEEVLRITMAATLGCSIAPLIVSCVLRFPLDGKRAWQNATVQLVGSLAVSAVLIALSCVLADLFLASEQRPFMTALRQEFLGNWLLVAFSTATCTAFFHTQFAQTLIGLAPPPAAGAALSYPSNVAVKTRGETVQVQLKDVYWMEAQGNYVALHLDLETHLLRESFASFQARLDPQTFVRIHRRAIVAVGHVEAMSPLGSGDASLRLTNGRELRLSRSYRAAFVKAWGNN